MNKKYLTYLVRNYRIVILFFFILYLGISISPFIGNYNSIFSNDLYMDSVLAMMILSIILTFVLPVLLFSFVHRRRSADQFFALPISRKEQLITSLLFAFLLVFGYFLISSFAIWILFAGNAVAIKQVLLINGVAALMCFSLLMIHSAWFLIANNIFDGIVMIGSWSFLPLLAALVISSFATDMIAGGNYGFTTEIAIWISPLAMNYINMCHLIQGTAISSVYQVLILVWTIAAAVILYYHFIKRKSERAEQLSNDPLAYKFIINTYAAGCLLILSFNMIQGFEASLLTLYLLLLFIYVIAQFVYRRKIRITAGILIWYAGLLAASLIFSYAAWNTHAFGIADRYTIDRSDYLTVSYQGPLSGTDDQYVRAEVNIPVDRLDQNKELIDLFDRYRKAAINSFYQGADQQYSTWLHYSNHDDNFNQENQWSYRMSKSISLNDLKTINKYTQVYIYSWYGDEGEISLTEYLKQKGESDE